MLKQRIHHDQARLRTDLQTLLRSKSNWTLEDDAYDIFSPQAVDDTKDVIPSTKIPSRNGFLDNFRKRRRPPRLLLPQADDLSWLMRHLRRDIFHSSGYLDSLPVHRPRVTKLPEPFYAPCLRITAKKIYRLTL